MKKFLIFILIISLIIFVFWGIPMLKCEYLTARYGHEFDLGQVPEENSMLATDNPQERDSLHTMADEARRLAREGTPLKYGQDAVMDLLHANAKKAQRDIYFLRSLSYYNPGTDFATRVAYLISMVDKGPWDYKLHSKEWRVPYDSYNGNDMDEEGVNNRNWREWIYFDGMIMGADKLGNMNMAYVGVKLGLPHYVYQNFTTNDKDDPFWVQYGIDMAEQGR